MLSSSHKKKDYLVQVATIGEPRGDRCVGRWAAHCPHCQGKRKVKDSSMVSLSLPTYRYAVLLPPLSFRHRPKAFLRPRISRHVL